MEKIYSYTIALCPQCGKKVDARIIEKENKIFLEKFCKEHNISLTLISSDAKWYSESRNYVKPTQYPLNTAIKEFNNCPDSCGLCPEHLQHTCMPIIEITDKCNLRCPICLKKPEPSFEISSLDYENILSSLIKYENVIPVINLSGGEPTIHPRLADFLKITAKYNITQTTVSTNGIRLLKDKDLRNIFKETGTIAALQFDGFLPNTYTFLRGKDLASEKLELIKILESEGIKYSLVSTIIKGVNYKEIKDIVNFFFESKALSLMFQPITYTGRAYSMRTEDIIITIPDIIKGIERSKYVNEGDFNPLPCSHFSCFALAYYFVLENGKFLSLKDFLGKDNFLEIIANKSLPGLDTESFSLIKEKLYECWSASDCSASSEIVLNRIRKIIDKLNETGFTPKKTFDLGSGSIKAIFIHQFMDIHTFDFGRIIKCCNHYPQTDKSLVPICVKNL